MSETAEEKEDILTTPFEELSEEEVERLTAFAGVAQRLMEAAELFDEVVKVLVLSLFRNETTNILLNVASLRVIIEASRFWSRSMGPTSLTLLLTTSGG